MPTYGERLPLTVFWTDDGAYVTAASAEHAALLGKRVLRLNGRDITSVADTIRLYLPHEN